MKTPKLLVDPAQADAVLPPGLEEEIRCRAYQIYEERRRIDGYDVADWLRGEAEIMTHRVLRKAA